MIRLTPGGHYGLRIEFMSWYEGQGEQDFSIWLECRKDEGLDVRDFIPTESYDRENKILHLSED